MINRKGTEIKTFKTCLMCGEIRMAVGNQLDGQIYALVADLVVATIPRHLMSVDRQLTAESIRRIQSWTETLQLKK